MWKRIYAAGDSSMFYQTIKSHTHIDTKSLQSYFLVIEGRHKIYESKHRDFKTLFSFNEPTHLHTLYYPSLLNSYTLYQLYLKRASSTCQIRIERSEPLRKEIYD